MIKRCKKCKKPLDKFSIMAKNDNCANCNKALMDELKKSSVEVYSQNPEKKEVKND